MIGYGAAMCAAVFVGAAAFWWVDGEPARDALAGGAFLAVLAALALVLLWTLTGFVGEMFQ